MIWVLKGVVIGWYITRMHHMLIMTLLASRLVSCLVSRLVSRLVPRLVPRWYPGRYLCWYLCWYPCWFPCWYPGWYPGWFPAGFPVGFPVGIPVGIPVGFPVGIPVHIPSVVMFLLSEVLFPHGNLNWCFSPVVKLQTSFLAVKLIVFLVFVSGTFLIKHSTAIKVIASIRCCAGIWMGPLWHGHIRLLC